MRQIQPDLWETETESPFPGLTVHAYLLTRDEGNVLFYNTGHRFELDRMAELGGVVYQLLSHRDELGETIRDIRKRFGAKLGGHVREREDFSKICPPDILFDVRETLFGNIEILPTPGHTPGSTCYFVHSPSGGRYLFTGDTIYRTDEGWKAGLLPFSDRDTLIESLRLLRTLTPDVVISSAFAGEAGFEAMTPDAWAAQVDRALAPLLQ